MEGAKERQRTRIAPWGNSAGVRIPSRIMRHGFSAGDEVSVFVNERGNIEIEREDRAAGHRRARPAAGITFDVLFAGWPERGEQPPACAWPDDMAGAELESWSR